VLANSVNGFYERFLSQELFFSLHIYQNHYFRSTMNGATYLIDDINMSLRESPNEDLVTTILVAEDEPLLQEFVSTVLRSQGYRVLLANDGVEALKIWNAEQDSIDLLITDIVMPNGISGRELGRLLLEDRPNLRIIYTSGYNPELIGSDISEEKNRYFLPKPYPTNRLIELVTKVLRTTPTV